MHRRYSETEGCAYLFGEPCEREMWCCQKNNNKKKVISMVGVIILVFRAAAASFLKRTMVVMVRHKWMTYHRVAKHEVYASLFSAFQSNQKEKKKKREGEKENEMYSIILIIFLDFA